MAFLWIRSRTDRAVPRWVDCNPDCKFWKNRVRNNLTGIPEIYNRYRSMVKRMRWSWTNGLVRQGMEAKPRCELEGHREESGKNANGWEVGRAEITGYGLCKRQEWSANGGQSSIAYTIYPRVVSENCGSDPCVSGYYQSTVPSHAKAEAIQPQSTGNQRMRKAKVMQGRTPVVIDTPLDPPHAKASNQPGNSPGSVAYGRHTSFVWAKAFCPYTIGIFSNL